MLASTHDDGDTKRASLAGGAGRRPSLSRAVRPLVIAALCALVAACGTPAPKGKAPPIAGWQAAIGKLEVTGTPEICTAVLVRPNVIATAAHCLTPNGFTASASQIVFTSSATGASARGTAIIGQGGDAKQGKTNIEQAKSDWALIRIAPAIANVPPMAVAPISAAMARVEVAQGAQFYSAGYGAGAKNRLIVHRSCGLVPPDPQGLVEGDLFFSTTCIVRVGDSGGPVALIDGGGPKLIGLNVGFGRQPKSDNSIGIVVSAKAFGPFIDGALVGFLPPVPGSPSQQIIQ